MKTTSLKVLVAVMVTSLLVIQSCSEFEPSAEKSISFEEIRVVKGRLSFPSRMSYFETLMKVNKMTTDELSTFQKKYNFSSLFNLVDTLTPDTLSLKRFPDNYQSILNSNGEVVVGDTIVWYAPNEVKHFVPNLDEALLSKIKEGSVESKLTKPYQLKRAADHDGKSNTQGRFTWVNPGDGNTESRWQHEFCYHNDCGSRRKYVNELWMTVDDNYYSLYIVPKMEWYGNRSHRWNRNAGEYRYVHVDIVCTVQLEGGSRGISGATYVPISTTSTRNTNWNIPIAQDFLVYSYYAYWDIDIRGHIYQEIVDDGYSGWNCAGNPLW